MRVYVCVGARVRVCVCMRGAVCACIHICVLSTAVRDISQHKSGGCIFDMSVSKIVPIPDKHGSDIIVIFVVFFAILGRPVCCFATLAGAGWTHGKQRN